MKNLFSAIFFACLLAALGSGPAQASKTVTSPGVSAGEVSVQSKSEYTVDDDDARDGAWKEKITLGYGINSYWGTEIEANIQKSGAPGAESEVSNIDWKNKLRLSSQDDIGLDTAVRFSYAHNTTGDPDSVELRLIAARTDGNFHHRANISVSTEIGGGANDIVEWDVSWSTRHRAHKHFQPGFEIYSAFGEIGDEGKFDEQDHRIGPAFYGSIGNGFSYDVGYLFGVSDAAPDGMLKAIVGYKF